MVSFDQISPIVLLAIFGAVFYFSDLVTALLIAGISGTFAMIIGIAIRAGKLPKIDKDWKFHDSSSGVFIKKREGQVQYASIFSGIIGVFIFKSEYLVPTFSFFTSLPAEYQGMYAIASRAVGYFTAFE